LKERSKMNNILILDTSYMTAFSVLLVSDGYFESLSFGSSEVKFTVVWRVIDLLFSSFGISKDDITTVAVSKGPGPFSSVRTGMTITKTLHEIKRIPVITFSVFDVLSNQFKNSYFFVDGRARKFIVGSSSSKVRIIRDSELEEFIKKGKETNEDTQFVSINCQYIIADLVKGGFISEDTYGNFVFYDVLQPSWIKDFVFRKIESRDFDDRIDPLYIS